MARTREHYEITRRLYLAEAEAAYILDVFGDKLVDEKKVPKSLDGIEAVNFYLVKKFNWPPVVVRGMTAADKEFALTEELQGFVLPKAAILK